MPSTILILSGGLDSTVLLYHLLAEKHVVKCLSFDYGQRHGRELLFAAAACQRESVEHRIVDLTTLAPLFGSSALVNKGIAIPHGDYAEPNMKTTVVPNRNMIMLSIAAAWAIDQKANNVAFAAHNGYHTLYPDCTQDFIDATANAMSKADWHHVDLITPFATWTKADIVQRGVALAVPFAQTWSCYEGNRVHCGDCSTCRERRQAFVSSGAVDPTEYAN